MLFAKPAISIADQITLLERRGLIIADKAAAEHYLRHISYYRLRAYWLGFEIPAPTAGQHQFKSGTTFEEILDLYIFDRKLRLLTLDAIERFEVSLRGVWAHHIAITYGAHGYLDPSIYRDIVHFADGVVRLDAEFSRSRETFAIHYRRTYEPKMPPLWMAAEIMSFGNLSKRIDDLKAKKDRRAVASVYGFHESVFVSFIHHISYVRNICAHHSRLWNRSMTIKTSLPRNPSEIGQSTNRAAVDKIYNTFVIMAYILNRIAPGTGWRDDVAALFHQHPSVNPAAMGFRQNWRQLPVWI